MNHTDEIYRHRYGGSAMFNLRPEQAQCLS
jgi:hypothetical protein